MMVLKSTTDLLPLRVRSERGVALFLALILISTLSVLSVSLMFLAQCESFSSGNYRLRTQARYGAEAGVQKTADYILNTYSSATAAGVAQPHRSSMGTSLSCRQILSFTRRTILTRRPSGLPGGDRVDRRREQHDQLHLRDPSRRTHSPMRIVELHDRRRELPVMPRSWCPQVDRRVSRLSMRQVQPFRSAFQHRPRLRLAELHRQRQD
jgi:hypothetical protein